MSDLWPTFATPIALSSGLAWTATFESYDQRLDDCYYRLVIVDGDKEIATTTAKVALGAWAGDNWDTPEFVAGIQQELAAIAEKVERPLPSLREIIESTDKPEWAILVAYETAPKPAIKWGAFVAEMLTRGRYSELWPYVLPWPGPFEAVDRWAGGEPDNLMWARAVSMGTTFIIPVAIAVHVSKLDAHWSNALQVVFALVGCLVMSAATWLAVAWMLRRQVARFDASSALQFVQAKLEVGLAKHPDGAARAMKVLRTFLARDAERETRSTH